MLLKCIYILLKWPISANSMSLSKLSCRFIGLKLYLCFNYRCYFLGCISWSTFLKVYFLEYIYQGVVLERETFLEVHFSRCISQGVFLTHFISSSQMTLLCVVRCVIVYFSRHISWSTFAKVYFFSDDSAMCSEVYNSLQWTSLSLIFGILYFYISLPS